MYTETSMQRTCGNREQSKTNHLCRTVHANVYKGICKPGCTSMICWVAIHFAKILNRSSHVRNEDPLHEKGRGSFRRIGKSPALQGRRLLGAMIPCYCQIKPVLTHFLDHPSGAEGSNYYILEGFLPIEHLHNHFKNTQWKVGYFVDGGETLHYLVTGLSRHNSDIYIIRCFILIGTNSLQ